MDLLEYIKNLDPELPVIMITGHGDIPMAVDASSAVRSIFCKSRCNLPNCWHCSKSTSGTQSIIKQREAIGQSTYEILLGDSPLIVKIREK